jgi:hypothetical protein
MLSLGLACGSDSTAPPTPTQATIAGTWTLQTLNGQAVPVVLSDSGGAKLEVVRDVFTLVGDHTFTQVTAFRITAGGQATTDSVSDLGTYVVNGTAVSLTYDSDGSTSSGSWQGNTITLSAEGFSAVYTR